jgi:hypothetical protein
MCEHTFDKPCVDLLTKGTVTTRDVLRDDKANGNCILCLPPGKDYKEPPLSCPLCICQKDIPESPFIQCFSTESTEPLQFNAHPCGYDCPPSQYKDFTNFTIAPKITCPTDEELKRELNCFPPAPSCDGVPGVPCEVPFKSTCVDLLSTGQATTKDILRDDLLTGGCILCVPPGDMYLNAGVCPSCPGAMSVFYAISSAGICPPSQYADFTDFTVIQCRRSMAELEKEQDCGLPAAPSCDGVPDVPCEVPFDSTCVDLLSTGQATTDDILRDDELTGGCILCVPPGGQFVSAGGCPSCSCMGSEIACVGGGVSAFGVDANAGECPPSQYADFTDFTVIPCQSIADLEKELDCGGGLPAAPSCDGVPGVPCEVPFDSTCVDLLSSGQATTDDILRDDESTGGCILCVPPGGEYVKSGGCPSCYCMGSEMACLGGAISAFGVDANAGECPPSQYADFTDFTVIPCQSIAELEKELDCGGGQMDISPAAPSCDGVPGVPCEVPFDSACVDLLSTGQATTNDILRDDESTGGCILCVPPGFQFVSPEGCPSCSCIGSEIACVGGGLSAFVVDKNSGECPPSQYADFTDFTVTDPCPSFAELERELDCPKVNGLRPPSLRPVEKPSKPAKQAKNQQAGGGEGGGGRDKPERQEQPDKAAGGGKDDDKPANKPEQVVAVKNAKPDKPAKMPRAKKTKGERV